MDLGIRGKINIVTSGNALSCKMQKLDRVVVSFFGNGATSCGALTIIGLAPCMKR